MMLDGRERSTYASEGLLDLTLPAATPRFGNITGRLRRRVQRRPLPSPATRNTLAPPTCAARPPSAAALCQFLVLLLQLLLSSDLVRRGLAWSPLARGPRSLTCRARRRLLVYLLLCLRRCGSSDSKRSRAPAAVPHRPTSLHRAGVGFLFVNTTIRGHLAILAGGTISRTPSRTDGLGL